jgi:hypothetical protein
MRIVRRAPGLLIGGIGGPGGFPAALAYRGGFPSLKFNRIVH